MSHVCFIGFKIIALITAYVFRESAAITGFSLLGASLLDLGHHWYSRGMPMLIFQGKLSQTQSQLAFATRRIRFLENECMYLLRSHHRQRGNPSTQTTQQVLRHILEHALLSESERALLHDNLKQLILLENSEVTMDQTL